MVRKTEREQLDRLTVKTLDQVFIARAKDELNCSLFEAQALTDLVKEVYLPWLSRPEAIQGGQLVLTAVSADEPGHKRLSRCKMVPVVLTLYAGEEDCAYRVAQKGKKGIAALRRRQIERMAQEALGQGALLTAEDLAFRIFNCGLRTISRDLQAMREEGMIVPLRSQQRDIGRALTHRVEAVELYVKRYTFTQIGQRIRHSLSSISNYVVTFTLVVAHTRDGGSVDDIAFLMQISPSLIRAYQEMKAINTIRKSLPYPPPKPGKRGGGPLRDHPPSDDPNDPATQRWYWRRLQRQEKITHVHELAQQGLSQRAIARQTGHHRQTVKRWLAEPIPPLPEEMQEEISVTASLPVSSQRQAKKRQLMRQVHTLRGNGLSYSAIAREVGVHRVTVKKWLQSELPPDEPEEPDASEADNELVLPPASWSSWEEVRQVCETLREYRFLFLRRPENLSTEDQQKVSSLLASPIGDELAVVRNFLIDWYRFWTNDDGERRSLVEAQARYETWRAQADYGVIPQLRRIQELMTEDKFEKLSHFLRHPGWEATNNGAERMGRAFRHRQAPHFNLRSTEAIEGALVVAACKKKEAATQAPMPEVSRCRRGRKRRHAHSLPLSVLEYSLEEAELVA